MDTYQETELLNKIKTLRENEEMTIKVGMKYGQLTYICDIKRREVIFPQLTENQLSAKIRVRQVIFSDLSPALPQENDGQNP